MIRLGIVVLGVTAGFALRWFLGVPENELVEPGVGGTMRPKTEVLPSVDSDGNG